VFLGQGGAPINGVHSPGQSPFLAKHKRAFPVGRGDRLPCPGSWAKPGRTASGGPGTQRRRPMKLLNLTFRLALKIPGFSLSLELLTKR
jgi:hypothetical protein